jgi:hypothetical protein
MADDCRHSRNDRRWNAAQTALECNGCDGAVPFPMPANRCGHHGRREQNTAGEWICWECGAVLDWKPPAHPHVAGGTDRTVRRTRL